MISLKNLVCEDLSDLKDKLDPTGMQKEIVNKIVDLGAQISDKERWLVA